MALKSRFFNLTSKTLCEPAHTYDPTVSYCAPLTVVKGNCVHFQSHQNTFLFSYVFHVLFSSALPKPWSRNSYPHWRAQLKWVFSTKPSLTFQPEEIFSHSELPTTLRLTLSYSYYNFLPCIKLSYALSPLKQLETWKQSLWIFFLFLKAFSYKSSNPLHFRCLIHTW